MENEIKIIISADVENAVKSLEQLGQQLTKSFSGLSSQATRPIEIINKRITDFSKTAKQSIDPVQKAFQDFYKTFDTAPRFDKLSKSVESASIDLRTITKPSSELVDIFGRLSASAGDFSAQFASLDSAIPELVSGTKNYITEVMTLDQMLQATGFSMDQLHKYMRQNFLDFNENGMIVDKLTGKLQKNSDVVRGLVKESRRFNFQFLSILFTGMALDRVFGSLIQAQMQLWGVTDLISSAWSIVLIPVMEQIVPIIIKIIEWFMNLDPVTQQVIGWIVLLGAALGKALIFIGQFLSAMIFLTGKTLSLSGSVSALGKMVTAVFGGISATVLAVVAVIVAVIVGMYLAFQENFLGMKKIVSTFVEGFKQTFSGVITFFKGVWDIIKGLFTGNADLLVEGVKKVFIGLWNFLTGILKLIGSIIVGTFVGALRVVVGIVQTIINLIGKIPQLWGGKAMWKVDWVDQLSIPSFKEGGMMPYTGLAYLHAGEQIIPRERVGESNSTFAPVINVNANTNANPQEIGRIVSEELNRAWSYKFSKGVMR